MATITRADVVAGVRTAIAAYAQALDDGRTEDVVATFCADGVCDMGDLGVFEGREAIGAAFARWTPRQPQRHLVVNTLVTDWDDQQAQVSSDVVFLLKKGDDWSVQMVGRYRDVLHREDDGAWRFHHRTAEFVP